MGLLFGIDGNPSLTTEKIQSFAFRHTVSAHYAHSFNFSDCIMEKCIYFQVRRP